MIYIELVVFSTFLALAVIFVALGLYRTEHTELCMIGFIFIFLLSFVVITNNLTYKTGETVTITNTPGLYNGTVVLLNSTEVTTYDHTTYQDTSGFFTTHRFGYLLAVLSVIGLIGSFVSIRPEEFFR